MPVLECPGCGHRFAYSGKQTATICPGPRVACRETVDTAEDLAVDPATP